MAGAGGQETATGGSGDALGLFLGKSGASTKIRDLVARAARVDSSVLITGESGVGKELVAREIHHGSGRSRGPFIPLNCAAIPHSLIESELFGHEAGAYTDARTTHRGAFEISDGGTMFLDEVGDLSLPAQPKLLRALESSEILRVGGEVPIRVDLRILAATNHDLKRMCKHDQFRLDLYFRLGVIAIHVPPLRERLEDIPVLADHFARILSKRLRRPFSEITPAALNYLESYHWPGNVRELKSMVERALVMNSAHRLDDRCFELDPVSLPGLGGLMDQDWRNAREGFEGAYALRLLRRHRGDVRRAAQAAGLARGSFYKMLRRQGLRPDGREG